MKKNLLSFLFLESAHADAVEAAGHELNIAESLEQLFEAAAEIEKGELESKKTPLAKALSEFGIADAELQLDPEGFCLVTDNRDRYSDILAVLGDADAMHKLAEMGWVVTKPGDAAMTSEPAEYRIRFLEITTVDTGDKDKSDEKVKAITQAAREFATTPLDRDDDLNPVETDDGEMGKKQVGVGKASDGTDPEGKPKGANKVKESWPERQAKPCSSYESAQEPEQPSTVCFNCGWPRRRHSDQSSHIHDNLNEMTSTSSMGTVEGGPQGIVGAGIVKKPKPYGKGTRFAMPGQWTVKQPIVKQQMKRKVRSESTTAEEFLKEPLPGHPSTCRKCGKAFNFASIPETRMGSVLCPHCGAEVDQTGTPAKQ
jgi:hypothetical protein